MRRLLAVLALASLWPAGARAQHMEPPRRADLALPAQRANEAFLREGPVRLTDGAPASPLLRAAATRRPVSGRFPLLLIPALFADSREPHVDPADLRRILFDGPSSEGTLPEFYREASRGLLEVQGTVTPWVRTGITMRDAAGDRDGHGFIGDSIRAYVKAAVRAADAFVDYGEFDNDGPDGIPNSGDDDGIVDGLSVEFLEVAGSCGGPAPWPHLWVVSGDGGGPFRTEDPGANGTPIGVQAYIVESVTDCSGVTIQGVGIVAHEFGHTLGLPDLYRQADGVLPGQRHWVVGCFDIMGAGSWGCGSGALPERFGPSGLSPRMKSLLGWIDIQDVGRVRDHEVVLDPVLTSGRAVSLPMGPGSEETVLIEYRPRSGFDMWLPAGGVLLYHRDTAAGTRPSGPGAPPPYAYHLLEADDDWELRRVEALGGNRGEAADVFAADGPRTGAWIPAMLHDGSPSTFTLHSVRIEGGQAVLRVSTDPMPAVIAADVPAPRALESYEGRLRLAGGALPYASEEAPAWLPSGLRVSVQGDEVVIEGVPLRAGALAGELVVRDARGTTVSHPLSLAVADAPLPESRLLAPLLDGGEVLAPDERRYLDLSGNANGGYDVGDLRAYLLRR